MFMLVFFLSLFSRTRGIRNIERITFNVFKLCETIIKIKIYENIRKSSVNGEVYLKGIRYDTPELKSLILYFEQRSLKASLWWNRDNESRFDILQISNCIKQEIRGALINLLFN